MAIPSPPTGSPGSARSSNIKRAKTAVQNCLYSKAIQALSSEGLASPSPAILEEMQDKHPQDDPPLLSCGPTPPLVSISEQAVLKGVHSFTNCSAPGPSGLRPSHLLSFT